MKNKKSFFFFNFGFANRKRPGTFDTSLHLQGNRKRKTERESNKGILTFISNKLSLGHKCK